MGKSPPRHGSNAPASSEPKGAAKHQQDPEHQRKRAAPPGMGIGDRHQALESEGRLRALIEASPLGIDIMDLDGNPIFYNPRCEELHGISFSEADGKGWAEAVHADDRERVAATWYEAAAARRLWRATYRFQHRDGRIVWVSGRAAPMYVDGQHVGFVGTLEDITELKAAEAAAEQAARLRDEMLSIVAHELRNPLQALGTGVEAMFAIPAAKDERAVRQLEIMRRTVRKMDALIGDLLAVGQMEAGRYVLQKEAVLLPPLVKETLETFEAQVTERAVELTTELPPHVPPVRGDRGRLAQVLSNLVENALKFTPPLGRIKVSASVMNEHVRMSVEDTGPGVPAENLPHIFDRFWQAPDTASAGSGLGLAIAKGIVEAHGGELWADAGQGAKFHFTLPFD